MHRKIRIISKDSSDLSWYDGNIWGRYADFVHYSTSRGYIVFGNDIISHGRSITTKSSCLYLSNWNDTVKDMITAREYVSNKYPELPISLLAFFSRFLYCKDKCRSVPLQKRDSDWYRSAVRFPDEDNENLDREKIYRKDVLCF